MNASTLRNMTDEELIRAIHSGYNVDLFLSLLVIELTKRLEKRIGQHEEIESEFEILRKSVLGKTTEMTELADMLESYVGDIKKEADSLEEYVKEIELEAA